MPEQAHAQAQHAPVASADTEWSLWMQLAQAGDQVAYQRLLQSVVPYLATIARGVLSRPDAVDDAVQDVLMIVHSVRHTYEPGRPLKPWLATIARRHCIDLERRSRRRAGYEGGDPTLLETQPAADPSPEDALARAQETAGMRAAVQALPPRQRTAVELLKLRELSAREASAQSGLGVSALKVACHRALKSLRGKQQETRDE